LVARPAFARKFRLGRRDAGGFGEQAGEFRASDFEGFVHFVDQE